MLPDALQSAELDDDHTWAQFSAECTERTVGNTGYGCHKQIVIQIGTGQYACSESNAEYVE